MIIVIKPYQPLHQERAMKVPSYTIKSTTELLTSRSGLPLLGHVYEALDLEAVINDALPQSGSNRGFSPSCYVTSLCTMLHAGGECLQDMTALSKDPVINTLSQHSVLPHASSYGSWLQRIGESKDGLPGLAAVCRHVVSHIMQHTKAKELTLDIDATAIFGEKQEAKYTYKGFKGYMPMVGHIAENGALLADDFRAGNIPPASEHLSFYHHCVGQLPQDKRIAYFRADSASYQAELMNQLDYDNITYAIGGKMCAALKEAIEAIEETRWRPYHDSYGVKTRSKITKLRWTMADTNHNFTVVIIRKHKKQGDLFEGGYDYHLIATNKAVSDPQKLVHWYSKRGDASENRIKELKHGFATHRLPCRKEQANAAFFRIATIAYNLFVFLKRAILEEKWQNKTINTLRFHLYNIPGKIVKTARSIILKVPEYCENTLQRLKSALQNYTPLLDR